MELKNDFRSFGSDNNSPICEQVLNAIINANKNHAIGYGDDIYTKKLLEIIEVRFGKEVCAFLTFNGTGANTLALKQVLKPYNCVICPETAHINVDETSAPENIVGCKIIPLKTNDGKLKISDIKPFLQFIGNIHHSQPKLVAISNSTEVGTVYSKEELIELSEFCHENNLLIFCDGARISNAAAYLSCGLEDITVNTNLDIWTIGGTKNGLMCGEILMFKNKEIANGFQFLHKTGLQLSSKMRFLSSQFLAFFEDNLWEKNAKNANLMAKKLEQKLKGFKKVEFAYPVQANAVFIKLDRIYIDRLLEKYFFYIWDEKENIIRLMTSFDTKEEDIEKFIEYFKKILQS